MSVTGCTDCRKRENLGGGDDWDRWGLSSPPKLQGLIMPTLLGVAEEQDGSACTEPFSDGLLMLASKIRLWGGLIVMLLSCSAGGIIFMFFYFYYKLKEEDEEEIIMEQTNEMGW